MLFSRSSSRTRGNLPATITTMLSVLAAVGCGGAESPFAPDFGVEETPRLSTAGEQPSAGQSSTEATEASALPGGEAPARSVIPGDGQPVEAAPIMLRGPTSINTDCRSISPLIVIDGVRQPEDSRLSDIESLDIEHVEIVKGAGAMILYGPRARNGAIDIQTKRGN